MNETQHAWYQRIDPDGTRHFITKEEYDAGMKAARQANIDPGFYIDPPKEPNYWAAPVSEYASCIDPAIVLDGGKHYSDAGLSNLVSLVRHQWAQGKTVVLTGTHIFLPPPKEPTP